MHCYRLTKVRGAVLVKLLSALACALLTASCATTTVQSDLTVDQSGSATAQGCDELASAERATLVIVEPTLGRRLVCNSARAAVRFVPASTYKVPHTLIALDAQAVSSINEPFSWDGRDRGVPAWNRNLDFGEAIAVSAVWVFQDVASRLGSAAEAEWIGKFEYGNQNVGTPSDLRHFWLSGPLKISADEQIEFLMRLAAGELPVSARSKTQTISALRMGETSDGFAIYGKTGAMLPIDDEGFLRMSEPELLPTGEERTGWFVGWIDRPVANGGPIYFAHNLDLSLPDAMTTRTQSVYELLERNGFPSPSLP